MKKIKSNNSFKIVALIAVVAIAAVNVKIALQDYVPALHSGLTLKNIEAKAQIETELLPFIFQLSSTTEGKSADPNVDGGENTGSAIFQHGTRKDEYKITSQCVLSDGYTSAIKGGTRYGFKGKAGASVPVKSVTVSLNMLSENSSAAYFSYASQTYWIQIGHSIACFSPGGTLNCTDFKCK